LSGTIIDKFTAALLSVQSSLKSCNAVEFRRLLSSTLSDHVITVPRFNSQLRRLTATIIEPAGKLIVTSSFTCCWLCDISTLGLLQAILIRRSSKLLCWVTAYIQCRCKWMN